MTLEEYKKNNGQGIKVKNKYIKNTLTQIFLSIVFVLIILIICNLSIKSQDFITKHLFETDFKFSSINKLYNKYFLSFKEEKETPVVEIENLEYKKSEKYKDGVKLEVDENYTVKLLQSGIVVFIGEKEGYGNTIIIQQSNGIDAWYGNITNSNIKLYDYIEKGTIIGNANKTLYLVFQKEGIYQDYNEFIK